MLDQKAIIEQLCKSLYREQRQGNITLGEETIDSLKETWLRRLDDVSIRDPPKRSLAHEKAQTLVPHVSQPALQQVKKEERPPQPEVPVKRAPDADDFDDELEFNMMQQQRVEVPAPAVQAEEAKEDSDESARTTGEEREERQRMETFLGQLEMRISLSFKRIKRCCKASKIKLQVDSLVIWNRQKEAFYSQGSIELETRELRNYKLA